MPKCADCDGSGKVECPLCRGTASDGRELCTACDSVDNGAGEPMPSGKIRCKSCGGTGQR